MISASRSMSSSSIGAATAYGLNGCASTLSSSAASSIGGRSGITLVDDNSSESRDSGVIGEFGGKGTAAALTAAFIDSSAAASSSFGSAAARSPTLATRTMNDAEVVDDAVAPSAEAPSTAYPAAGRGMTLASTPGVTVTSRNCRSPFT